MINVLENIPFQSEGLGKRKLVETDPLLMMQIALKPGQHVPQHNANSHVHLIVLQGDCLIVTLEGVNHKVETGTLLPVEYQTSMMIKNEGKEDATFVVIKTPHPNLMK